VPEDFVLVLATHAEREVNARAFLKHITNGRKPCERIGTLPVAHISQHEIFARIFFGLLGTPHCLNPSFALKNPIIFLTTHPQPVKLEEWYAGPHSV
jgi:hypothetical protein